MAFRSALMLNVSWDRNRSAEMRSHAQVASAKRYGRLAKLTGDIPCKDCGKPAVYYDHRNYFEPLKVDPVCAACNQRRGPAFPHLWRTEYDDVRDECREALRPPR